MSADAVQREADQIPGIPLPEETQVLAGHDAVREALDRQVAEKRLPGAWLLQGPRGIGKATLGFALARDILLATGDEDARRIAEQVAQGVHPNLFVLRKKARETGKGFYTAIRVQEVRALRDSLHRTRGRAGHRVCVVDAIDDCNASSANALLKILEEPPADTLFILVSHRPGSLLPTIRSRCQVHALRPLDAETLTQLFAQSEEDPGLVADALTMGEGRPRRVHELCALGQSEVLFALRGWLSAPEQAPEGAHLELADLLAAASDTERGMARDLFLSAIAAEARGAAQSLPEGRSRLASATQLWDKANAWFAEAETYNLDLRQTYVFLFDSYLDHRRRTALQPAFPD